MNATLNITLNDYNALVQARTAAEQDAAKAREEARLARLEDPSAKLTRLLAFTRDVLDVARFGIAHLPPETVRNWPYETLRRAMHNIDALPDCSTADRDMAIDLVSFARECEVLELRRRGISLMPAERTEIGSVASVE